ncbi:hypothetical protein ABIE65_002040 [Constrictibacter sp. MBR-5]|jgi:hypothetical protein|uniref:hypothetical protein n=1 Tax=Constrictibacter sp. MBR-5 TaxID=3156467 RepID=UPI00339388CB
MIECKDATEENLAYIWQNMRKQDKTELTHMGYTDANYIDRLINVDMGLVVYYEGVPLCYIFAQKTTHCAIIGFFATPEINKRPFVFHLFAKGIVDIFKEELFGYRCMICLWEKYERSKKWVKALGFTPTKHTMFMNNELFRLYENR